METAKNFWIGLTTNQRTIVMVVIALLLLLVLGSFVFMGTDYSGFGDWLQSWGS